MSLRGLATLQRYILKVPAGNDLELYSLKVDVGEEPVAVLVTAVLRQGSLTEGNVKQFEFRPSDILLVFNYSFQIPVEPADHFSQVTQTNVENIELASNLVAVDRRQGVPNRF